MILTSPSGSLAYDLFSPEILGDLVKKSRGEQRTEREQVILFFKFSTVEMKNDKKERLFSYSKNMVNFEVFL